MTVRKGCQSVKSKPCDIDAENVEESLVISSGQYD